MGLDLLHPDILDADLLSQKRDLPPESLQLLLVAEPWVEALHGQAEGPRESETGEGDGVHGCRANVTGPAAG
jgi:hypothetical protein